jgi:ribosomal protein S14
MKYKLIRNKNFKNNFQKNQVQYIYLKTIIRNNHFPFFLRWEARLFLSLLSKNINISRSKRYCFLTGRNRGHIRYSGLSRIETRLLSRNKNLPSFVKNNW